MNIETLISKNIITITAKKLKIIQLPREKKTLIKDEARKKIKIKIIIIALIMGENSIKEKKPITLTKEQTKNEKK